VAFVINWKN